ncbi:MAG: cation diffusion facilitator family transporter [Propionibacteriaceae bacterium]|jgi:cation diffusion facilitator family transporter|nr:cation diffusion facilitator family transporter [Propionibacteriaceae bacterium]
MSQHSGIKAVIAAMSANIAIAVMKLVAWLLTGAASMLAEAIHSFADSANQILILIGGKAASKKADDLHPFGFGRDRYIAGFMVAIILFSMGGLFALYEAYHKFKEVRAGHPNDLLESVWWWVPLVVLAGSIIAESLSLRTAVHESKPLKGKQGWFRFIRTSKSPELPVILLEDTAALLGLAFALIGVGMTLLTGVGYWDVVGSGAIGILLIIVAVILASETKSLLLGEAASPEHVAQIESAIAGTPGIEKVIYLKTVHLGPEEIMVAAKIAVPPALLAADLADLINLAEAAVRGTVPMVGPMYLEPDVLRENEAAVTSE